MKISDWRPPSKPQPFAPPFTATSFAPRALVGPVRPTFRLGMAVLALYVVNVVMLVITLADAVYGRRIFEEGIRSGFKPAVLARLQTADRVGDALLAVSLGCTATAVIVLAIWSHRVATNAKARGVLDVSPGLAAGGWFIPFANTVVPFVQLRRAARPFIGGTASITAWQVLGWFSLFMQRSADSDLAKNSTPEQVLHAVSSQIIRGSIAAVAMGIALVYAARAITEIDRTVSVTQSG